MSQNILLYTRELTILVAEDDPMIRKFVGNILSRYFKNVILTKDGQEAWEKLEEDNTIDLLLTDISMPRMNGVELVTRLRQKDDTFPIIVVSAHNEIDFLVNLINIGVDGFLTKPVDTEMLEKQLQKTCKAIINAHLLTEYQQKLEESNLILSQQNDELIKKNRLFETKTALSAYQANSNRQDNEANKPTIEYYDFLIPEDLIELEEILDDLDAQALLMFTRKEQVTRENLIILNNNFSKFSNILAHYTFFSTLSRPIFELGESLSKHSEQIMQNKEIAIPLIESLIYVLEKYVINVWRHKVSNPNYYDASIISDIQTILLLIGVEEGENDAAYERLVEFF